MTRWIAFYLGVVVTAAVMFVGASLSDHTIIARLAAIAAIFAGSAAGIAYDIHSSEGEK